MFFGCNVILFLKKYVVSIVLILSIFANAQVFEAVIHWQNYCTPQTKNNCSTNSIELDHFSNFTRDQRMQQISDNELAQRNSTRSTRPHQTRSPTNSHHQSEKIPFNFTPIDVKNITIAALNSSSTYYGVAFEMSAIADLVLDNAKLCNLDFISEIEIDVHGALDNIRMPRNNAEFIFNVAMIDHLLSDIQNKAASTIKNHHFLLERSSELLARAIKKFVTRLNPVTQVTDICKLATSATRIATKALLHPIDTAGKIFTVTKKSCVFYNRSYLWQILFITS